MSWLQPTKLSHSTNCMLMQLNFKESIKTFLEVHSLLVSVSVGPVHVHNAGTVIFSLLSHFTSQVGPTTECGKTTERVSNREKDERDCPVFHPTRSPSIHLSEEERSGEMDSIFFPSQEQGKDCHVSKEESLWYIIKMSEDLCWWLWLLPYRLILNFFF